MSTSQEQERDRKKRRAEGVPASSNSNDVDNQDPVAAAAQKKLAGAKVFILKRLVESTDPAKFWTDLPLDWKSDREVAVVALQHDKIRASDLPADLQTDRAFLIGAVNKNTKIWYSLPDNFKNDISFARSITSYTHHGATEEILGEFPPLANERDVWSAIICNSPKLGELVYSLVVSKAPPVIRSDRELMLKACSIDPEILVDVLGETFARDGDFVRDLLTLDPQLLARTSSSRHNRCFLTLSLNFCQKRYVSSIGTKKV